MWKFKISAVISASLEPYYNRDEITEEFLVAVVGAYEDLDECGNHPSLQVIVDELDCGLNPIKVRKLLITAGETQAPKMYKSATADEVLRLWKDRRTAAEIMSILEFPGFREFLPSVHENCIQNERE